MFKKLTQAESFGIFSIPWGVFVLALAIRVAYIFQIETSPLFAHPPVDGLTYVEHAQDLAAGNWLGQGREAFWQPPLYPYMLGLLYALSPDLFFYAVRFFQALCGAVLCVLTWSLGRQLFNTAVGAAAACAAALYGPLIFFDGEILPATMGTFLNMAGLALLLRALRRPSFLRFAGAGLVFGLAVLTVATVLSFALGAAIYVCYEIRKQNRSLLEQLRLPSAFLLGLLVAIAPVTLRNYAIGGDAVLISANAGINFYLGNNPDYQRTVNIRPGWEWYELLDQSKVEAQAERLVQQSDFYMDKAREYIVAQPVDYLVLLAQKTHLFWQGDEIGRNQDLYFWRRYTAILSATMWKWGIAFPFGLVGPLALVGLALAIRHRAFSLPLLFVVLYSLSVIAFFATARYRLPVIPLLLVYAAYGGYCAVNALRQRRFSAAAAMAAGVIFCMVFANVGLAPMNVEGAAAVHYNMGNAYAKEGELERAQAAFERAVYFDSAYWQAWYNLASVQAAQGQAGAAAPTFQRVLRVYPQKVMVWISLARAHRQLGENDQALKAYETALRRNPSAFNFYGSYSELIDLYLQQDQAPKAERVLEIASKYHPVEAQRLRDLYGKGALPRNEAVEQQLPFLYIPERK